MIRTKFLIRTSNFYYVPTNGSNFDHLPPLNHVLQPFFWLFPGKSWAPVPGPTVCSWCETWRMRSWVPVRWAPGGTCSWWWRWRSPCAKRKVEQGERSKKRWDSWWLVFWGTLGNYGLISEKCHDSHDACDGDHCGHSAHSVICCF